MYICIYQNGKKHIPWKQHKLSKSKDSLILLRMHWQKSNSTTMEQKY